MDDKGERVPTDVKDKDDGTYEIKFTAHRPGTYCLKVSILNTLSYKYLGANSKVVDKKAIKT